MILSPKNALLDDVDRAIVHELQRDARMPNARLAERVGIAQSTCIQRVRSLVDRGVITGFTATIDPVAVGLPLEVLISVTLRPGARDKLSPFGDEIRKQPEVLHTYFLGAAEDYLLHIAARDTQHVREFVLKHLSANPAVASTRTSLVFETHRNPLRLE